MYKFMVSTLRLAVRLTFLLRPGSAGQEEMWDGGWEDGCAGLLV